MNDEWPIEDLERRAREERGELHERADELRSKARTIRENLDTNRYARRHFGGAAAVLAAVGLLTGYAFAGLFTSH